MKTRKRRPPRPIPETEVQLCEELITRARLEGFAVFPEVSDWDLIIVDSDGVQLGVQAKMRANVDVIGQAIRRRSRINGPRHRAVLVPKANGSFYQVARALGLHVFTFRSIGSRRYREKVIRFSTMKEWKGKPYWLPPVPSSCPAGSPSPRPLTQWRVRAIELCLLLEEKGHLTGEDFKRAGINQSTWLQRCELKRDGKVGRFARYVAGPNPLPIVGFETEAKAMKKLKL